MPKVIVNIINWLLVNNHPEAVIGDTEEEYYERKDSSGKLSANLWLCKQILIFIPLHYSNSFFRGTAMFKNYFKIGYRNLIKEKLISAVSVIGLGIGMAAAMLLLIFIHHDLSYDNFMDDADRIYRMYTETERTDGSRGGYGITMSAFTQTLREMPEIESATKLYFFRSGVFMDEERNQHSMKIFSADTAFFDVLNFKVTRGNKYKCFDNPSAMVLTEKMAMKIWGTADVIGRQLEFKKGYFDDRMYVVSAVIEDIPVNSHLQFDCLVSESSQPMFVQFGGDEFLTYYKLKPGIESAAVNGQILSRLDKHIAPRREAYNYKGKPGVIAYRDMHLKSSSLFYGFSGKGSQTFLYVISAVAFSVLLISILNFINLLSAKFQNRTNEIGIRKVVGAARGAIFSQFAAEAIVITFFASLFSLAIVLLTLEDFGNLVLRELNTYYNSIIYLFVALLFLSIGIGCLASLFPSVRISSLNCVNILNNKLSNKRTNKSLPATIVVQFSIVMVLMICISVIFKQVEYMKNKDTGFEKEQLIYFNFTNNDQYQIVKERLLSNPDILSLAASQTIPGMGTSGQSGKIVGLPGQDKISINESRISPGYVETFGLELAAGRSFDEKLITDKEAVLVNESLVKAMGLRAEEAIGRDLKYMREPFKIIGVLKDYHFQSLHNKITPLALSNYSNRMFIITAKIKTTNISATLEYIENLIKEYDPEYVFNYSFVDEYFDNLYSSEERNNELLFYSSTLAIILSVMGLFAVTLFAVTRRTKEIGIRKVLGCSVSEINILLIKNYLLWVLIANLIAWPVAYFSIQSWLENFAYRIELHPGYFIFAGLAAFFIALATIIYITTRASLQNPVKNLRYE